MFLEYADDMHNIDFALKVNTEQSFDFDAFIMIVKKSILEKGLPNM